MVLSNLKREQEKGDNKKRVVKMRWLALLLGIVMFSGAYFKEEVIAAIFAFAIGGFSGFIIDYVGGMRLKLWRYPRQEFLKINYFAIVVPGWGVLGMIINLPWNWINMPDVATFISLTMGHLLFWELINLKLRTWEYYITMRLVVPGWFPLILGFRALFTAFFQFFQ